MIQVDVRADIKSAQIMLHSLSTGGTKRATSRALNRTATTVRAEGARLLKKKRNLPIGEIKKAMKLKRATINDLLARITVSGKPIAMRHFINAVGKYRGSHGASARVEPGTKRIRLQHKGRKAFVNPKWNPNVFVRTGVDNKITKWRPVPGLPTVLVQSAIVAALKATARRVFLPRFEHEVKYEISRAKARAGR